MGAFSVNLQIQIPTRRCTKRKKKAPSGANEINHSNE
jgi:hypothetical protein